eukprot:8535661-Alexandrium_andersonii.AAC.1
MSFSKCRVKWPAAISGARMPNIGQEQNCAVPRAPPTCSARAKWVATHGYQRFLQFPAPPQGAAARPDPQKTPPARAGC